MTTQIEEMLEEIEANAVRSQQQGINTKGWAERCERLVKALRKAAGELQNIVDADLAGMRKDFGADTDRQFRLWAQNRARDTLAQLLREPAEKKERDSEEKDAR